MPGCVIEAADAATVLRLLPRAAALGCTAVVLDADGIARRRELLAWAARAASLGLDLALATDEAPAPATLDALLALRLRAVTLRCPRVPDAGYPAIAALVGRVALTIEHRVTSADAGPARAIARWLLPLGVPLRLVVDPAADDFAGACAVAAALGAAHDGAPLCLAGGAASDGARARDLRFRAAAGAADFVAVEETDRAQPAACDGCALAGACPGLPRARLDLAPSLRPVRGGARGNSFTFAAERALPKLPGGGCPIYAAPRAWHPARHLFLDGEGAIVQHFAGTRDFSEAAIAQTRALGQLYLDRSDKPAPDEFPRDLARLALADGCRRCDRRAGCAGTFAPVAEDVFTRADERVRARVAAIAADGGRVVDVGCGDGRYGDLLAPAARAGRLRYLGVEPDAARAADLASRWPWAEVRAVPVEQLAVDGPLDALLVLRSWNHLADPAAALAPLVAALRPGAPMLVVDNVPFALVRTAAQAARAEAPTSPAGFEHHRNDDADAAERALADLPLTVEAREPVAPDGANQWLLALRRRW